jgi:diguanylate cyclase (GGDEF)-like protein/PAS domain S-box-containing protein
MNSPVFLPDAEEHEALLQFLYMAPVGLVQLAHDGGIVMINPLAAQLLMPLSPDGDLANLLDVLGPVAPDLRLLCRQFASDSGPVCDGMRLYLPASPGASEPRVLSLTLLKLDPARMMAVLADITRQERQERQLRTTDAWLNAIMTNISDYALVGLDRRGRVQSWNESVGRVTGHNAPDIEGRPYGMFYPEGATTAEQQADRLREADQNGWTLDEGLRLRADGSEFWGSTMISPLPRQADDAPLPEALLDREPAYCMIIRDISDKRKVSEDLRKATYGDHLTGLSNRRSFFEAAELELQRRQKVPRPVALLVLDADHFKRINDTYGHPAGDEVLRQVAATMKKVCRHVDVVARIGGEEFAVMLPSVELAAAMAVAERLRAQVEATPVVYEGQSISYTVSIGVAAMDDELTGIDGLLKRADQALYRAKRQGRNRVAAWEPQAEAG